MLTKTIIHAKHLSWLALLVSIVLVVGCTGSKQFGRFHFDNRVKSDFEAYRVLPQYNYYFSGSKNFPRGIIGIRKEYELVSRYWNPIDLTERQLTVWIQAMTHVGVHSIRYEGYTMTTPQGNPVGIWYSNRVFTNLYMVGDRQITVTPPAEFGRKPFSPIGLGDHDD